MVSKPSIVKQLTTEVNNLSSFFDKSKNKPRTRYVDPTDTLILEEETQKIVLAGKIDINQLITDQYLGVFLMSIVMAVHGYENDEGVFIVTVYCCKDLSIPKTLSPPTEDKYILFETSIIFNQLEYLINSLTRPTNLQCEQIKLILRNIVRFFVAGNSTESSD
ncbi:unnamed protein product [Rotaria socialis]